MEEKTIKKEMQALLLAWCDALVGQQLSMPGRGRFDGGVLCPACQRIHGRCHEAVYPLLCAAKLTGEERYLRAARSLFAWGGSLLCDDGSLYNDANCEWNGTTVFGAVALHDALYYHGDLLTEAEKRQWEDRLRAMGKWLSANLTLSRKAHTNYYAGNACAMALLGWYFDDVSYLIQAKELAEYCFAQVSESGLFLGEGGARDARTPKGCVALDPGGYDVEETLPSLLRSALAAKDEAALKQVKRLWLSHLDWMLPDGAWDNSVGSRNFKWTYWGSRTADGCADALFRLGKDDPVFAEAALRHLEQLKAHTHGGFLRGGPDHHRRGEPVCVHHTFCHAKTLAGALDAGLYDVERTALPNDTPAPLTEYPELATVRMAKGGWIADVTVSDLPARKGVRASGGVVTLLWHRDCGPVIACSMAEEGMAEPLNQQLSVKKEGLGSVCPRLEVALEGKRWTQYNDLAAQMTAKAVKKAVTVHVDAFFCDDAHQPLAASGGCRLDYKLTAEGLLIEGRVSPGMADHARYLLPVISEKVVVTARKGSLAPQTTPVFSLTPGFLCREYEILPDRDGRFALSVTV